MSQTATVIEMHPETETTEQTIARLLAENAKLKGQVGTSVEGKGGKRLTLKVSEKGAVTLKGPGLRKFGVTLYLDEWDTLLSVADNISDFLDANKGSLAVKPAQE